MLYLSLPMLASSLISISISVIPPKAENTMVSSSPASIRGFTMEMILKILSGVATDDPPNFNTFINIFTMSLKIGQNYNLDMDISP